MENITKFITFGCWNNLNEKETQLRGVTTPFIPLKM